MADSIVKAFRFRIYPTKAQETRLERWLGLCRELYNAALQERRDAYRCAGESITYRSQANQLSEIKELRPDLADIHSQVLQDVLRRLDKGFTAFFRRVSAGEKPGFPRFRGKDRYHSFTYPQSGFAIEEGKLRLSKIGPIKIKQHREIEGRVKTCTVICSSTGKWFVCFSVETEAEPLPESAEAIGVDVGLNSFATLSDGTEFENPRFFRSEEEALAKAQCKLSAAPKGTPERRKRRKAVARVHERIAHRRGNFAHQVSHWLVITFGLIVFEKLNIKGMVKNGHLSKSISDAAWNQLIQLTTAKAECAGRQVVLVDPRGTSQRCSRCGETVKKSLAERTHHCHLCGLTLDRDHNAALNILALGLQCLSDGRKEAPPFYGGE